MSIFLDFRIFLSDKINCWISKNLFVPSKSLKLLVAFRIILFCLIFALDCYCIFDCSKMLAAIQFRLCMSLVPLMLSIPYAWKVHEKTRWYANQGNGNEQGNEILLFVD